MKWTYSDFLAGKCERQDIGDYTPAFLAARQDADPIGIPQKWTITDWGHGLCEYKQVGKWRKDYLEASGLAAPVPSSPDVTIQDVKQSALNVAASSPGGLNGFWQANPSLHGKFLLGMVRERDPNPVETRVIIDIPWLTRDRLAYQHEEPAEIIDISTAKPWKPEPENAEQVRTLEGRF